MKKHFLFGIVYFLVFFSLFADSRTENIDLFVLLDKSLSMVEEIEDVKSYVRDFLVETFLIPGDNLTVINFFGSTDLFISQRVDSQGAKAEINEKIGQVQADGRWTDIGNALDALNREYYRSAESPRQKYLLLITDGIQEAPPDSRYYSPDGSFVHDLLENTKTIQRRGWKIQIIGIGSDSAARQVADELAAAYQEIPREEVSPERLAEASDNLLGLIQVREAPVFSRLGSGGASVMKIALTSLHFNEPRRVTIAGIYFQNALHDRWTLAAGPEGGGPGGDFFDFTLNPGETREFEAPLTFPLPEGREKSLKGTVFFTFSGGVSLTPAAFEAVVPGPFPWGTVFLGLGGLLLLVLLILLIRRWVSRPPRRPSSSGSLGMSAPRPRFAAPRGGSWQLKGSIRTQSGETRSGDFRLAEGESLYLDALKDGLAFGEARTSRSALRVYRSGGNLKLEALNPRVFKVLTALPGSILNKEIYGLLSGKIQTSFLFTG
ncbi:MAG: VWA domain-containing protein [Spirochaetales bacterium]|jgi:hypothetical protein|nr:VWA domain-containing protein [Spirochaetales bacterium]